MNQDEIFKKSEGDKWFERNENFLRNEAVKRDVPLYLIRKFSLKPKNVLEVGCSNGWRLNEIRKRCGAKCTGVEPSQKAISAGKRTYRKIIFRKGAAADIPAAAGKFDLVIVSYVFHWISRKNLLRSVAEIDRVLMDGGFLVLCDFLPDRPVKVFYHHLPKGKVYTYKTDYGRLFTDSGIYKTAEKIVFNHDKPEAVLRGKKASGIPDRERAVCYLLRKNLNG